MPFIELRSKIRIKGVLGIRNTTVIARTHDVACEIANQIGLYCDIIKMQLILNMHVL